MTRNRSSSLGIRHERRNVASRDPLPHSRPEIAKKKTTISAPKQKKKEAIAVIDGFSFFDNAPKEDVSMQSDESDHEMKHDSLARTVKDVPHMTPT